MSSILKALKKLENQAEDQNHVQFWRPKSHIQNDDHEPVNGHLRFKKGYVIIFVGLVFVVGAGLILSQTLYEKKPELITKKEDRLQKPVRLPEKKAVIPNKKDRLQKLARLPKKKAAIPDKKTIHQKPARLPEKKAAMPDRAQKKFKPIAKATKAAPPPSHKSRRNTAVLFNKRTSPPIPDRKITVAGKPGKKSGQNTKADLFASMPVKRSNQTKIKVQAIAWANDPKRRLAVINGLMLREGESIDNVMVMHIGKDSVVFKKGAEGWKQMFGF